MSIVEFLRARYGEEQAEVEKSADVDDYPLDPWAIQREETGAYDSYAYLRITKARALAEVEAKRQILDEHPDVNGGDCGTCVNGRWGYPTHGGSSPQRHPCRTLRLLAVPFAAHPDYDERWRP
ncbi:DUF6221 family protein [Streptomyces turgidiscabies]|uniref:DUF6221 family protein n=1 Tax=Streptomyces turgidiscabies TaxID=85558 RepID=UPI0038F65C69